MKIQSSGGYFGPEASQETPDTHTTLFEYADGTVFEFATRGQFTNDEGTQRIGNLSYGAKGWIWIDVDGRKWQWYFGPKNEPGPGANVPAPTGGSDPLALTSTELPHYQNFVDAIRANDTSLLNSGILDGHLSSTLPHLANIAHRVGHSLTFDGRTETFVDDKKADQLLTPRVPQRLRDSEDHVRRLALVALVLGLRAVTGAAPSAPVALEIRGLRRPADHRAARRNRPDRWHARENQRIPRGARSDRARSFSSISTAPSTSSTRPART